MSRSFGHRVVGVALTVALALSLAACGDDDSASTDTTAAGAVGSVPSLLVTSAWARTSAASAANGVVYLKITGGAADDRLTAASVAAEIAAQVELHETVAVTGDTSMTTMAGGPATTGSSGAMMGMQPVDAIDVPAGSVVELQPGGYHIMLIDLAQPLKVGTDFDLTLTFDKAGQITVPVEVEA